MSELCKMHPRFSFSGVLERLPRMTFPKVRSALKKGRQNKASVDVPGRRNTKSNAETRVPSHAEYGFCGLEIRSPQLIKYKRRIL